MHRNIDLIVNNKSYIVVKSDKTFTSNAVCEVWPSATNIVVTADKETLLERGVT